MKTAVVALGGNTLVKPGDEGTAEQQFEMMEKTCEKLAEMIKQGYDLVLTHGNGPQVGDILLQNEIASDSVPPMPLDICGAQSQGQIGYMFQQTLKNKLNEKGVERNISSIITQVEVDRSDPAFEKPSKFIGPTYSEEEAEKIKRDKNWAIKKTARGEYRRVVPSPKPQTIVESAIIEDLVFSGEESYIVISAGGGGVPVLKENDRLMGVEGVIDKDRASAVLANDIDEDFFIMLTNVENVYLNFNEDDQKAIGSMDVKEAKKYLKDGHFPAGSMRPKIEASIDFLEQGGKKTLITDPENLLKAIDRKTGTYIYPE
ncbi:MAG: carbamate kinase [Candidatus Thermoplasmatota archaeon]|nr:carbamate kinase [Candidatus Thermoplasmatota archaeon]MBS3789441.1 carbamate kinase [Candidatus Thermoplasmatota archaeon]